jgi:hypothetical protein
LWGKRCGELDLFQIIRLQGGKEGRHAPVFEQILGYPRVNGARLRRIIDQPDHWQPERPPYNSCPIEGPALRMATRRQRLTLHHSA